MDCLPTQMIRETYKQTSADTHVPLLHWHTPSRSIGGLLFGTSTSKTETAGEYAIRRKTKGKNPTKLKQTQRGRYSSKCMQWEKCLSREKMKEAFWRALLFLVGLDANFEGRWSLRRNTSLSDSSKLFLLNLLCMLRGIQQHLECQKITSHWRVLNRCTATFRPLIYYSLFSTL